MPAPEWIVLSVIPLLASRVGTLADVLQVGKP